MTAEDKTQRWAARPIHAGLIRAFVFLAPIAGSVLFLHFAGRLVAVPTSSFWLFISWWVVMSGSATMVLFGLDRSVRRLLPLATLYKLSLVFPDAAPSRFRTAMRSNTVESLEERVARAKALKDRATPVEAAETLLSLVAELDAHDRLTRGHADRVRAYAQLIAKEMRLGSHERDLLNWAALLHDIGIDTGRATLDLQLRYRTVAEIDRARLGLWKQQLILDRASGRSAAVAGDVATIRAIAARS